MSNFKHKGNALECLADAAAVPLLSLLTVPIDISDRLWFGSLDH